ncbi:MAG: hypothetical protein ACR2OV_15875 [Hyphomicrobiaceae bacterium]
MAIKTTAEWYRILTGGLLSRDDQQDLAAALRGDFAEVSAAGGLWEQIGTRTTASSDATVAYSWATTYKLVMIQLNNVLPTTDDVDLYIRTSSDGGSAYDSGAADYKWTVDAGTRADVSDAQIICNIATPNAIGNAAGEGISGMFFLHDPANTARTTITGQVGYTIPSGATAVALRTFGQRLSAADVDGIQFSIPSDTIASGEFLAWGLL